MLDLGAKVNVVTRNLTDELGLPVRPDMNLVMVVHTGDRRPFDSVYEDVEIKIRGVTVP